jgi:hypothetical protein
MGKSFDPFVAFAAGLLIPEGLQLRVNRHVLSDGEMQTAELDIEITGQIGFTSMSWLIAVELANRVDSGVELREARALKPAGLADGPVVQYFTKIEEVAILRKFTVRFGPEVTRNSRRRVGAILEKVAGRSGVPFITVRRTGQLLSAWQVFASFARERKLYDSLTPNAPAQDVTATIRISDHLMIQTPMGPAGITEIYCEGSLQISRIAIPLLNVFAYDAGPDQRLPGAVKYPAIKVNEKRVGLELHRIEGTNRGQIAVTELNES